MIVMILYMIVGMLIGILIKSEVDNRHRKKIIKNRKEYLKSRAVEVDISKYDTMLESIRSINDSLSSMQNNNKKEVR